MHFSWFIAFSLVWADIFKNFWTPSPTPEGVKSKEKVE